MKSAVVLLASLVLAAPLGAAEPSPAGHRVVTSFPVGGDGGWDYLTLDAASRRVFISRGTHVMVVDADSGKVVGDIPGTEGVHGIALAPDLKKGFTSNGRANTVTVFELPSLAVTATIKVTGENPDAILYEPASKRVFTFNGRGKNVTAIDAASGAVAGTLPVGGKPEFAVSDAAGVVYVNVEDTAEVVAFDAKTLAVKGRWKIASCEDPTGLPRPEVQAPLRGVQRQQDALDPERGRRQGGGDRSDRRGLRCRGVRPGRRPRLRVERRRDAQRGEGNGPGRLRLGRNRDDEEGRADHGPRPVHAPCLSAGRAVRTAPGGHRGSPAPSAADAPRVVRDPGRGAVRSGRQPVHRQRVAEFSIFW